MDIVAIGYPHPSVPNPSSPNFPVILLHDLAATKMVDPRCRWASARSCRRWTPASSTRFCRSSNAICTADLDIVQWVVTIYLLIVSGLLLTFGRLGDLRGHRTVCISGFGLFVFGSALCGLAPSTIGSDCRPGLSGHRRGDDFCQFSRHSDDRTSRRNNAGRPWGFRPP